MRIWTLARLEKRSGHHEPRSIRKRLKLAGVLLMLAMPLLGVLLLLSAEPGGIAARVVAQINQAQGNLGNAQSLSQNASQSAISASHAYASIVVRAARSQIGARYATYGDTPQTGFSCVGLVHWAYVQAGLNVPESAPGLASSYAHIPGATTAGAHLQPGDILLFVNTAWQGYSHAAIYVGNGLMVSADSPQTGVRLEAFNTSYWVAHWAGAVRVPGLRQDVSSPPSPTHQNTTPPNVRPQLFAKLP